MPPDSFLAILRHQLGLTQAQMSALIGLKGKSLARLETGSPVKPSLLRLARLMANLRLGELESALKVMADGDAPPEVFGQVRDRVQDLVLEGASLNDTLLGLKARQQDPTDWVYWATSARAGAGLTEALADKDGFICRPLRFKREPGTAPGAGRRTGLTDYPYLEKLKVGHQVLLCHSGEPIAWYRLRDVRAAESGQPKAPFRFVRFVRSDSPLGARLAAGNYRLHDGSEPASRRGWFSGLAVERLPRNREEPVKRRNGIRDTMTPFEPLAEGRR